MSDLLTLMTDRGISPRKISVNNGGEYSSSCPVCGDGGKGKASDRFHIWPSRETGGLGVGRFWCRQCGVSGDSIAFLQKIDGMSFPDACEQLGIALPRRSGSRSSRYQPPPVIPTQQQVWQPKAYVEPGDIWVQKAGNLLADCQDRLANEPEAIGWLEKRGITRAMIDTYRLGYNQSSKGKDRYRSRSSWGLQSKKQNGKDKKLWIPRGWVIPSFNRDGTLVQLRIRRRNVDVQSFGSHIKYLPIDGSSMAAMVLHPEAEVFVIVESGFDAILLAGLTSGKIGAITTWNSSARPDVYAHALLQKSSLILGALDYDHGGNREQGWWKGAYKQYRRLPILPGGAKDPGEAAERGADLLTWLVDGLPRGMQIKLGFTRKPANKVSGKEQPGVDEKPEDSAEVVHAAEVAELVLTNGKVIYVTNDPAQWEILAAEGKPVFSQNELERLKEATSTMNEEDRLAAAMKAIEAKEIFGGYIKDGRCYG